MDYNVYCRCPNEIIGQLLINVNIMSQLTSRGLDNTSSAFVSDIYINKLHSALWELKERPANFIIYWKILSRARAYSGGHNCDLCITEKHLILKSKFRNLLNSRTELISKCRHTNEHMLKKSL